MLQLQLGDPGHHLGGGHAGLAATGGLRPHGPRPVVAAQDFADAAVGHLRTGRLGQGLGGIGFGGEPPSQAHLEATGDVRGPDPARRQLDDPLPLAGGEGAAVHEETPQLVHAAGSWERAGSW